MSKYFNEEKELSCNCRCGLIGYTPEFMALLDMIRERMGKPVYINSGARCDEYNKYIKGSKLSAHTPDDEGHVHAVDIKCDNSMDRAKLLKILIDLNITRIGIAKSFIHFDIRETLPQNVTWMY